MATYAPFVEYCITTRRFGLLPALQLRVWRALYKHGPASPETLCALTQAPSAEVRHALVELLRRDLITLAESPASGARAPAAHPLAGEDAGGTGKAGVPAGPPGRTGPSPASDGRQARLAVTAEERLRYSRARLSALSALRRAGLPTDGLLAGKSKVDGRFVYLLAWDGQQLSFASLKTLTAYAHERRRYTESMAVLPADARFSWRDWQQNGPARALALVYSQLQTIARHP